ncbi:hypothetical protein [Commensalibacter communis]|uniref:hypothetical protein n=1 Tax=Commensalibacter communis TaxID=2972786 RepID=UPI0022FF795C|nr:hypothetical protein [Commensalibacter communis]CAI3960783.1 unnamed protein product [Commensalibacter communis]CAI3960919.1 unnamed protein product [Commensalibacter communis]
MSIVSITKASKLTGKSRQTLYKHLQNGQLSLSTDVNGSKGLDTSELIRVYGQLKIDKLTTVQVDTTRHELTKQINNNVNIDSQQLTELEKELALSKLKIEEQQKQLDLKQDTINAKQETIDSLKTALKLLEHSQDKSGTIEPPKEDNVSEPQKNGISVDDNGNTGLLGRLKKLFN